MGLDEVVLKDPDAFVSYFSKKIKNKYDKLDEKKLEEVLQKTFYKINGRIQKYADALGYLGNWGVSGLQAYTGIPELWDLIRGTTGRYLQKIPYFGSKYFGDITPPAGVNVTTNLFLATLKTLFELPTLYHYVTTYGIFNWKSLKDLTKYGLWKFGTVAFPFLGIFEPSMKYRFKARLMDDIGDLVNYEVSKSGIFKENHKEYIPAKKAYQEAYENEGIQDYHPPTYKAKAMLKNLKEKAKEKYGSMKETLKNVWKRRIGRAQTLGVF